MSLVHIKSIVNIDWTGSKRCAKDIFLNLTKKTFYTRRMFLSELFQKFINELRMRRKF